MTEPLPALMLRPPRLRSPQPLHEALFCSSAAPSPACFVAQAPPGRTVLVPPWLQLTASVACVHAGHAPVRSTARTYGCH